MKRGDIGMSKHHHRDCCREMFEHRDRCGERREHRDRCEERHEHRDRCMGNMYLAFPIGGPMGDPPGSDPCFMTPNGPVCGTPEEGSSCFMTPYGRACPGEGGSCSGPGCSMPRGMFPGGRY